MFWSCYDHIIFLVIKFVLFAKYKFFKVKQIENVVTQSIVNMGHNKSFTFFENEDQIMQ